MRSNFQINPFRGDSHHSSLSPCPMPVASLLLRKQLKTTRLPFLVNCFHWFDQFYGMTTWSSSDRLWLCIWHRRTPADFRLCIVFCFWVWWLIITVSFSVCIFVFIFRRILSGNVIVRVTGWTGSEYRRRQIRLRQFCFQISSFPRRNRAGVFLIRTLGTLNPAGFS